MLEAALARQVQRVRAAGLARERLIVEPRAPRQAPAAVRIGEREYVEFCSNDYLGLAAHPRLAAALAAGAGRYGVGSGASQLVSGYTRAHAELEEALAEFAGRERALLFSSGYLANFGLLCALAARGTGVCEDRLNHASLVDGARLSGARVRRYRHADPQALRLQLARMPAGGRILVVTDGLFSMGGDLAPLEDLSAAARDSGACLVVDDAHALGVMGPGGRGTVALAGLTARDVPVLVGTLGKAFGTAGAFVAGSAGIVEAVLQRARTLIYTTAPPPALAVASRAALELAASEPWRRERVLALAARFRAGARELGLPATGNTGPIEPLVLGDATRAVQAADALAEQGLLVRAIRPPTVPDGTARLRITFSAAHSDAQVDRLLEALSALRVLWADD